jgi:hypothetical protein
LLLLTVGIALGASRHSSQRHRVMATAEEMRQFELTLGVAVVQASPAVTSVTLPGTTAAFAEASVYARAAGYIAKRNVDIGDHVKNGELLAELAMAGDLAEPASLRHSAPDFSFCSQNTTRQASVHRTATFVEDTLVSDQLRDYWGKPTIREWAKRDIIGERLTMIVIKVIKHYGNFTVSAKYTQLCGHVLRGCRRV